MTAGDQKLQISDSKWDGEAGGGDRCAPRGGKARKENQKAKIKRQRAKTRREKQKEKVKGQKEKGKGQKRRRARIEIWVSCCKRRAFSNRQSAFRKDLADC